MSTNQTLSHDRQLTVTDVGGQDFDFTLITDHIRKVLLVGNIPLTVDHLLKVMAMYASPEALLLEAGFTNQGLVVPNRALTALGDAHVDRLDELKCAYQRLRQLQQDRELFPAIALETDLWLLQAQGPIGEAARRSVAALIVAAIEKDPLLQDRLSDDLTTSLQARPQTAKRLFKALNLHLVMVGPEIEATNWLGRLILRLLGLKVVTKWVTRLVSNPGGDDHDELR